MLHRFVSALSRSGEPSGNVGSSLVICVKRPQSSVRVRRISSAIVSTRIFSSIIFDRANRGLLTEALRRRRRVHRLRRERRGRVRQRLQPCSRRTVRKDRKNDGVGVVGMGEPGVCATQRSEKLVDRKDFAAAEHGCKIVP
jgi:hypothetical protein